MFNKPPFELNNQMTNLVAEITEKIGRLEENQKLKNNLHLRRENRIKTIKSTTAIENNTLSLKQVTDVINGKIVMGKQEEIKEVKNAFIAYDNISKYNQYDIDSFLKAHFYLTSSLINTAGQFRKGDVTVYDGKRIVHVGARPEFVNDLVFELFEWAKTTDTHPLILSAIIHYEIETIHPFDDGNGRIGRLWQTTILSKWKSIFEYIPIETVIYKYQPDYYKAIESSREKVLSNDFIIFMLNSINETLDELDDIDITDIITDKVTDKLSEVDKTVLIPIIKYLLKNPYIDNSTAQKLTNKRSESIKKYLNKFSKLNIIIPIGENKGRKYKINIEILKTYN